MKYINTIYFLIGIIIICIYIKKTSSQKAWRIEFNTSSYNCSSYIVEVIRTTSPSEDPCFAINGSIVFTQTVPDRKPKVIVEIPRSNLTAPAGPNVPGFCIQVTSSESGCCEDNESEEKVVYRKAVRTKRSSLKKSKIDRSSEQEQPSCSNLTGKVSLELRMDVERKTIESVFKTSPCECLSKLVGCSFSIYVRQNGTDTKDCSDPDNTNLKSISLDRLNASIQNCSLVSGVIHAKPGNYCTSILFRPKNLGTYCSYATKIKPFYGGTPEEEFSKSSVVDVKRAWYPYLAILVSIVPVIIIFIYRKKTNRTLHQATYPASEGFDVQLLTEKMEQKAKELEVTLLYFHDSDEHDQAVETLASFLENTWKIGKVNMDVKNEAEMSILGPSYMALLTDKRLNRRIIVVESHGAVLQEEARRGFQENPSGNESFFNEMFQNGLETLKIDCRSFSDYNNLFVVRFEYTSPELCLSSLVPNRRYILPRHLFDLYCALVDLPQLTVDEERNFKVEMNRKWKNTLEYDLIPSINEAVGGHDIQTDN